MFYKLICIPNLWFPRWPLEIVSITDGPFSASLLPAVLSMDVGSYQGTAVENTLCQQWQNYWAWNDEYLKLINYICGHSYIDHIMRNGIGSWRVGDLFRNYSPPWDVSAPNLLIEYWNYYHETPFASNLYSNRDILKGCSVHDLCGMVPWINHLPQCVSPPLET